MALLTRQPGVYGLRVLGLEQATANLRTLSDKLQNNVVRQAARAGVRVMAKAVKASTYADGKRTQRTGLLKRSQSVSTTVRGDVVEAKLKMREVNTAGNTKLGQAVRSGRSWKRGKPPPAKFSAFYWWFLEAGTHPRRTARGANRGVVTPRAWVVPVFDAKSDEALTVFQKTLTDRLNDECNNLPKGP